MSSERKIIFGYLVTASFQVSWHWFLKGDTELSRVLLRFYLYRDPQSGKGVPGYFDLVLPALLLGVLVGWAGRRWTSGRISMFVALVGIGIVALAPIYSIILGKELAWWWPSTTRDLIIGFVQQIVKGVLLVGVFAYFGRDLGLFADKTQHE